MSTLQSIWDQIAPQAFQNQWYFALNLTKHLVRQLKFRNRNSEVERILQKLWDEAVRKHISYREKKSAHRNAWHPSLCFPHSCELPFR